MSKLIKLRQIFDAVKENKPLNNKTVNQVFFTDLQETLRLNVVTHLQEKKLFVEDGQTLKDSNSKTTKKLSSHEITLELWQQSQSVSKIAQQRMLTESTVFTHLRKLVETKRLAIEEIIPTETLHELQEIFDNQDDTSISQVHHFLEGKYDWDTLRIFKAWYDKDR